MYQKDGRMWDEIGDAGHGPEYVLCSPKIPTDRTVFLNYQVTDKKKQKYEHTHQPSKATYYAWPPERQQQFEEQEWTRREKGVWFYNCGVPTWITGNHYFFLNYHRYAGDVKPAYREANREFFWVWRYCKRSPNCKGLYNHTRRRDGKTSRAASIGVEGATRIKGFRFGMQSKTGPSARDSIFKKEVLPCVKALAECPWFMPALRSKIDPGNNLVFGKPTTSAKKDPKKEQTPEDLDDLNSEILWADSPANALDSDGMTFFFNDEVAKEQLNDSYRRWTTVSRQFSPNGPIIGKGICATTTDEEELDANGNAKDKGSSGRTTVAMARKFWETSDHTQLKDNLEQTESGMFRLFTPAHKGFLVDEYGRDTPESKEHFLRIRAKLKGLALMNEQRANPFNIEEALMEPASEACPFHVGHISDNELAIKEYEQQTGKPLVRRYNLYWEDEATKRPPVRAVPEENGRWQFPWLPPIDQLNQMMPFGKIETKHGWVTKWKPLNTIDYSIGTDPVEKRLSKLLNKAKASKAAAYVFRQHDQFNEALRGTPHYWPSHAFIGRYNARPENPEVYYDDMMKACHLFGTEIHAETQKSTGLEMHFEDWGYGESLAGRPAITENTNNANVQAIGTAASPVTINRYQGLIEMFIVDYVGSEQTENSRGQFGVNDRGEPYDFRRQPFLELHADNKQFNPEKTQFNDDSVAQGYTLLHAYRRTRAVSNPSSQVDARLFDPNLYFRR
jgi:hypothetical protein